MVRKVQSLNDVFIADGSLKNHTQTEKKLCSGITTTKTVPIKKVSKFSHVRRAHYEL